MRLGRYDAPHGRYKETCVKTLKRILLTLLLILVVGAGVGWFSLDKEARGLLATVPTNRDILF